MNQNSTNYRPAPAPLQQMGHIPNQAQQQVGQQQAYSNAAGHRMRQGMPPRFVTPTQGFTAYQPIYAYPQGGQLVSSPFTLPQGATIAGTGQHTVIPQTQHIVHQPHAYYPAVQQLYSIPRQPAPGAHGGSYGYDTRQQQQPQGTYATNRVGVTHHTPVNYQSVHPQAQHAHVSLTSAQPQPQQQPQAPQHTVQQSQQQQIPVHQPSNQSQIQQQPQHVQAHAIPQQHYQRVDGPGQQPRNHGGDQNQGHVVHPMGVPGNNIGGSKDTGTARKKRILEIINPVSGKNVFKDDNQDAKAPEASKDDEKKTGSATSETLEVSAAVLSNSGTATSTSAVLSPSSVASSSGSSDQASASSSSNNIREATPVLPGSTTDDSSSKTKVKSEFFNKISQANDDNKKPKSDETPVSRLSEDTVVVSSPAVVATVSPPSSVTSSGNSSSVSADSPVPATATGAVSSTSPTPPTPELPPATTTTTSPSPSLSTASTAEVESPAQTASSPATSSPTSVSDDGLSVKANVVASPEVVETKTKTAVIESSAPTPIPVVSIDTAETTTPVITAITPTEDEKVDEEIAKINNHTNKVETKEPLTNGIQKVDDEEQDNVPSDSHDLSTVSISPTPMEVYCGDNSVRSHDESTIGESLNEETNEISEKKR